MLSESCHHAQYLREIKTKNPHFYQYLLDNRENLHKIDVGVEMGVDKTEEDDDKADRKKSKFSKKAFKRLCRSILVEPSLEDTISLLNLFQIACHCGDDTGQTMSSKVFNKIVSFALKEMDWILCVLLELDNSKEKKEIVTDIRSKTEQSESLNHLVASYFENALHVLERMDLPHMILYTLHRLSSSSIILAAFPVQSSAFIKVLLRFCSTGIRDPQSVSSFQFLRDLCELGSDCFSECFKGIYESYERNCMGTDLQREFLGNCCLELLQLDHPQAYKHASLFILQLAEKLSEAHSSAKTKKSFMKVYGWKFLHIFELWTVAICECSAYHRSRSLADLLHRIIYGAACEFETANCFPWTLRCVKMLNQLAASTKSYDPSVSSLLLDMLDLEELIVPPSEMGESIDLCTILWVNNHVLKTTRLQKAYCLLILLELAKHLDLWSYSDTFQDCYLVPLSQLIHFRKVISAQGIREKIENLILEIEKTSAYTAHLRPCQIVKSQPIVADSFLKEKECGSPLSKYVVTLLGEAEDSVLKFRSKHSTEKIRKKRNRRMKECDHI